MSRQRPLHLRIAIGMLVGATAGVEANLLLGDHPALQWTIRNLAYPAGQIFLRLIFMVVVPLVFSALALGVAQLGDIRKLGRVGLRTLVFTLLVSALSVVLGIVLVNAVQPGVGLAEDTKRQLHETLAGTGSAPPSGQVKTGVGLLVEIIPENPVAAMATAFQGGMLGVMFFSLFVGLAMALIEPSRVEPLVRLLQAVYDVVMKVIDLAMRLAPYGVAALLFTLTARFGLDIMQKLVWYVLTVVVGLALHQFGVYSLLLRYLVKASPRKFFAAIQEVMLTAFSTSSSNATLPITMRVAEQSVGVPPEISRFVLTLGSTANQNGTALYEGITVLFLAQFFGIELSLGQQALVVMMAILAGVGTAGVPGGSLPLLVLLLNTIGIPGEGIAIILGVDRILDMCRTTVNVTGDVVAAAYVSAAEGYKLKV